MNQRFSLSYAGSTSKADASFDGVSRSGYIKRYGRHRSSRDAFRGITRRHALAEVIGVGDNWAPTLTSDAARRRNLALYLTFDETTAAPETSIRKWMRARLTRGKRGQQKVRPIDAGQPVSLDLSWAFGAMSEDVGHSTSQQIMSTISALNELLGKRQFAEMGIIFGIINPKRLSPELMLTLLRVTFPVRELVPGWYQLVRRIKTELDVRHLDSKNLLVGLL
jgi:hypothetical protein